MNLELLCDDFPSQATYPPEVLEYYNNNYQIEWRSNLFCKDYKYTRDTSKCYTYNKDNKLIDLTPLSGTTYRIILPGGYKVHYSVCQTIESNGHKLNAAGEGPIVTTLEPASKFYPAEEYHQDYFARNPNAGYCRAVVRNKVRKFNREFGDKIKKKGE